MAQESGLGKRKGTSATPSTPPAPRRSPRTAALRVAVVPDVCWSNSGSHSGNGSDFGGSVDGRRKGATDVMLDMDSLECVICFETIRPPIYQCQNGHIICNVCITMLAKRCPTCANNIDIRCRGLEKVVETLKILCENAKGGYVEKVPLLEMDSHTKSCLYSPFPCPMSSCGFIVPLIKLPMHINSDHKESKNVVSFHYNKLFQLPISREKSRRVGLDCEAQGGWDSGALSSSVGGPRVM